MLVLTGVTSSGFTVTDKASGQRMRIVIDDIRGNKVRLGFEAEKDSWEINRDKVQRRKDAGEPKPTKGENDERT